jgi:hypothetical protein
MTLQNPFIKTPQKALLRSPLFTAPSADMVHCYNTDWSNNSPINGYSFNAGMKSVHTR